MSFNFDEKDSRARYFVIQKYAQNCLENPEMMKRHFWRTEPCENGINCSNMDTCYKAHFKCECKVPMCIYMEFCDIKYCEFIHKEEDKEAYVFPEFKYDSPKEWLLDITKMKQDLEMLEIEAKLRMFSF